MKFDTNRTIESTYKKLYFNMSWFNSNTLFCLTKKSIVQSLRVIESGYFLVIFFLFGKLPKGNSQINSISLNRCPPYTEIFSKRRKIYSVMCGGLE